MARILQVLDSQQVLSANVKFQPLNKSEKDKQKVSFQNASGEAVKLTTVDTARKPVQTFKGYLDEDGNEYAKEELTAIDPDTGNQLEEFETTTVFEIMKYEPMSNYTDRYIVDKYYELFPSDDGKKKDIDRRLAESINRQSLKRLYDYLVANCVVAKAEFIAVKGYRVGAGYIRAITLDGGKWSLELGSFKEEKVFKHLQESQIEAIQVPKKRKAKNTLI